MKKKRPVKDWTYAKTGKLAFEPAYLQVMGWFHVAWAGIELSTDYAIYKFLGVSAEQSHLITSGLMFGRKARLLADLIARSDHPEKQRILKAFNEVRGGNLRDVFAHSYMMSDETTATYIERPGGGEFRARKHIFTFAKIRDHVLKVMRDGDAFFQVLKVEPKELEKFMDAALTLSRKDAKSPAA